MIRTKILATMVEKGIGPVCIRYFAPGTTGASLMAGTDDSDLGGGDSDGADFGARLAEDLQAVAFNNTTGTFYLADTYNQTIRMGVALPTITVAATQASR